MDVVLAVHELRRHGINPCLRCGRDAHAPPNVFVSGVPEQRREFLIHSFRGSVIARHEPL